MKLMALTVLISLGALNTYAQSANTSIKKVPTKKKIKSPYGLKLEMETSSVRDGNNDIQGNTTGLLVEPSYKPTKKLRLAVGTQYMAREAGGTLYGKEKANRDHLSTIFFKTVYNPTKYRDNGIADIRLQYRFYKDQDDFFNRRYASDGNNQARIYFGRPIAGKWSLNKYVTYLRYKKYYRTNDYEVSDFTRDYELRARVAPTYRLNKNLELGFTVTYNHIFKVNKLNDEEEIDLDLSARYSISKYAALLRAGTNIMNNEGGTGELKSYEDAGKEIGYALSFTAYL